MRKIKFWMLTAIFACGAAIAFTSCVSNEDNAGSPTLEEEEIVEALEIADAFEPVEYEVALLCDESAFDANELAAIKYWLPKVKFNTVTNETAVVITNEITEANKANIAKVLGENYGMLLLVDPKEANVKQYAEELNMDANADYENLELIGLTGFGDQFVSYNTTEETADAVPASIASDNIWDVAPEEYLRLKAFAQWVERIEKKYADYMAYLEDLEKKIIAADAELDDESASAPRRAEAQDDSKLNIATLAGIDKTAQAFKQERFESYDNAGRSNDWDDCPLSVTCNYHFKPVYRFPEGNEPGADYYVVDASVYWDCTETLIGWKKHDHGSGRAYAGAEDRIPRLGFLRRLLPARRVHHRHGTGVVRVRQLQRGRPARLRPFVQPGDVPPREGPVDRLDVPARSRLAGRCHDFVQCTPFCDKITTHEISARTFGFLVQMDASRGDAGGCTLLFSTGNVRLDALEKRNRPDIPVGTDHAHDGAHAHAGRLPHRRRTSASWPRVRLTS